MNPFLRPFPFIVMAMSSAHAAEPHPVIRVTLDEGSVVVGQKTTLRVEVLVPNYMTSPPELPDFQLRNAVTRQLASVNRSEEIGGVSYAGVRYSFAIYPQELGSYRVGATEIRVRYAAAPPSAALATIAVPEVAFDAVIPETARGLRPFVSAHRLTVTQSIERSSDVLKPGDSVRRRVTINAEGTPAMLLPPIDLIELSGLRRYLDQPALHEEIDSRTDVLSSHRTDSAVYMIEKPGTFVLPAIELAWWDADSAALRTTNIDPIPIASAPRSAATEGGSSESIADWLMDRWPSILALVAALLASILAAPAFMRFAKVRYAKRRDAYLDSETYRFRRLRRLARRGDPKAIYGALTDWAGTLATSSGSSPLASLRRTSPDPELDKEIANLETTLFGSDHLPARWASTSFLRRVTALRRRLRKRTTKDHPSRRSLNPMATPVRGRQLRPPAR